jgi:deoxyribose-phosphate aldolase
MLSGRFDPSLDVMTDRRSAARLALACMDLTRLEDDVDDDAPVREMCRRAAAAGPVHPAAVCVYPAFVGAAAETLAELGVRGAIRVATVANFPGGAAEPERAAAETRRALSLGANEVDVVFPWKALLAGDDAVGARLVDRCRAACGGATLKVILESGMLADERMIRRAARIALDAGADFIKTSTGKAGVGATPEAAAVMLEEIARSGREAGFKASGGVRTLDDARVYMDLATETLGADAVRPGRFRIGASGLLDALLAELGAA